MTANVDAMIREGIAAAKAGNNSEARVLLLKAVELDQMNEQAWLWLSGVVDNDDDRRTCLENVLAINPNNARARAGLDKMNETRSGSTSPVEAPPMPETPTFGAVEEFPTSVEWGAAPETSSPTAPPRGRELTDEEYDDWLVNLNLPTRDSGPAAPQTFTPPFGAENLFGNEDDDLLAGGPFSAPSVDVDDAPPPPPASSPRASSPGSSSARASSPGSSSARASSPGTSSARASSPGARTSSAGKAPPAPPPVTEAVFAEFEDEALEQIEGDDYLSYIPPEIGATRLPGTIERQPVALTLGVVALVLLNLGAAALLVYQLFLG